MTALVVKRLPGDSRALNWIAKLRLDTRHQGANRFHWWTIMVRKSGGNNRSQYMVVNRGVHSNVL
jgi:hypothetical protein